MECLVVRFLPESNPRHLEHRITIVKLLIMILGHLLEMQDCVSLLGVLILSAFGQDFADIVVGLHVRGVSLNDALQVGEGLTVLTLMIVGQATFEVALLIYVLIVLLVPLLG